MKRYLLFSGQCYYPSGGIDDFNGDFDSFEEAKSEYETLKSNKNVWCREWAHVWDSESKQKILSIGE